MQKTILFEESAVKEVLQLLRTKGYIWNYIKYTNKGRYAIIKGEPNIAILLKSEPFFKFGIKFLGYSGMGDSINTEHLKEFVRNNVKTIYTMFRDGKIYAIPLNLFLKKSYKWVQKEGTEVRSISIHEYMVIE